MRVLILFLKVGKKNVHTIDKLSQTFSARIGQRSITFRFFFFICLFLFEAHNKSGVLNHKKPT